MIENNPVYQNFHFNNDFGLYLGIVSSEKLDSDATPQIYTSKDKKYVILFCGKIYNCRELNVYLFISLIVISSALLQILLILCIHSIGFSSFNFSVTHSVSFICSTRVSNISRA